MGEVPRVPKPHRPQGQGGSSHPQPRTHLVTTLILTPKTPVCFLDGVLFRLMSLLVNFMENSTLICGDILAVTSASHRGTPPQCTQSSGGGTSKPTPLPPREGVLCPAYPVHLNHVHVPVLGLHGLRVQLRGETTHRGWTPAGTIWGPLGWALDPVGSVPRAPG